MKAALIILGLLAFFFWLRGSVVGWERRDRSGGWFRLWDQNGPGVAWCLKTQPLLFSQRTNQTRYVHIGRWRIRYLPRNRVTR